MLNAANFGILTEVDALYPFTVQPRVIDGLEETCWQASNLLTGWEGGVRGSYRGALIDAGVAQILDAQKSEKSSVCKTTCGGCAAYAGTKYS